MFLIKFTLVKQDFLIQINKFNIPKMINFPGGLLVLTAANVGLKQLRFFFNVKKEIISRNYGERLRYQKLSYSVKTELIEMSRIKYKIP